MLFGNPKQIFKMMRVAGVRIKFDTDKKALVVTTDGGSQEHSFASIEKMVNGDDNKR